MKKLLFLCICFISYSFSQPEKQENKFISAFNFHPNDLELSRLAQPNQYFDKIGKRAGLMGYENGQFEMWVWPWKPLRNFELQFFLGTSTQPILAKDIVRTISVTPELTTLTYTYESFTVKEHILIPRDEPGAILLLEVHTTTTISIIPGFIPVMQPMWPCGIGGQYSYWDESVNGYIISEGQKRAAFICGSPAGQQMAAPPAHMFADNPLQFKIEIKPGETEGKFIPIIISGAIPDNLPCNEEPCPWQKMNFDSVKATYKRLWQNAGKYYQESYTYYQNLRNSTLQITTPDKEINLAYEWGKVALDNLMITNPRLGYGMVAGYGLSGGGARPGFAWFFGGDAFINVLTMNSVGMFQQSRDALAFTQKWQRQDNYPIRKTNPGDPPKDVGKMSHELSQSDGLCDWWNDYRYGYNHADTSPWYLVAMGDYVRTSGDIEFLRQSWKSVKQAYDWSLSKDSDGDGLMDLKGAGLGALEFGKLVGIYADVYTCGVFMQGVKEMKYMAELLGDKEIAMQAEAQFKKAQPGLEKLFWLEKESFYAYGATDKGEQVREKTPWSGVAMMFGLFDEQRTAKSLEAFNSADLCTDWGVRTLSNNSELFEPTNYNYGAVWPFIGTFFNTAQFKHRYSLAGYQVLRSTIKHVFDHGLGIVPEVFSGELNEKLGEAYHHQGFSTTGYMLPLVRGLLGLETDGLNNEIQMKSNLPPWWKTVQVKNLRSGNELCDVTISQMDTAIVIEEYPKTENGIKIHFQPNGYRGGSASGIVNAANRSIALSPFPGIFDLSTMGASPSGSINQSLKFISERVTGNQYTVVVEGLSGKEYTLQLVNPDKVSQVSGAIQQSGRVLIDLDESSDGGFTRKEIVITWK